MRKTNTYALVENGIVVNTIVATVGFITKQPGNYIELNRLKKASPGFILLDDTFIPEKPGKDFVLDIQAKRWVAPKPRPSEEHQWDEKTKEWIDKKRKNK